MNINSAENQFNTDYLSRLSKVLNYQLSTTVLLILMYAGGFTLLGITVAAILFSPYMLYVLYLEKKNGWIIFFIILVLIPIITIILFSVFELLFIPLALVYFYYFYYFYYFLLKFIVRDWIQEKNAKWKLQKQMRESKTNSEQEGDLNFFIQR